MPIAAAGTAVHALLTGPPRAGRVVAALPAAVYIQLDPEGSDAPVAPGADVLALLSRDAVRVPVGVVLAGHLTCGSLPAGAPAGAGGGHVWLPGLDARVTRWWSSDLPRARPARPDAQYAPRPGGTVGSPDPTAQDTDVRLPAEVASASAALRAALRHGDPLGPPARALLGLGPGLTPAGDDVLAGALVTLHHRGAPRGDELAGVIEPLLHRTTTVSAALLRQAVLGRAVPELARFVTALAPAGPAGHRPRSALSGAARVEQDVLRRLLAVGSTSGACLAYGALAVPSPVQVRGPARPVEVW